MQEVAGSSPAGSTRARAKNGPFTGVVRFSGAESQTKSQTFRASAQARERRDLQRLLEAVQTATPGVELLHLAVPSAANGSEMEDFRQVATGRQAAANCEP